jgi:hypothetical protein
MSDGVFQVAYEKARQRYSNDSWLALTPRQITEAIYQEIRLIDAERAADASTRAPSPEPRRGREKASKSAAPLNRRHPVKFAEPTEAA